MKILIVSVCAWFIAQALKILFKGIKNKKINFYDLFSSGGMPSSHTALVSALATQIALMYGFNSPFFAIAAVNAVVVMYDAMGVRRAVGLQAQKINQLLDEENEGISEDERKNRELIEILGHTPFEVLGGLVVGIGLSVACFYLFP